MKLRWLKIDYIDVISRSDSGKTVFKDIHDDYFVLQHWIPKKAEARLGGLSYSDFGSWVDVETVFRET